MLDKKILKKIFIFLIVFNILIPNIEVFAATTKIPTKTSTKNQNKTFHYIGWLPFWKKQPGASSIASNLDKIYEISPFSYEIRNEEIYDALKINQGFWPDWLRAVKDMKIKIVPTIAWFKGKEIHALLLNKEKRIALEDKILKLVKDNNFDGIDIDFENKLAETNPYFSLFIKGLAIRLHPAKKILSCTIEPRTPLDSRYTQIAESETAYANDYKVLNQYCDEIRIMAYDQGLIDKKLNEQKGNGKIYAPVADPDWVKKVLNEALKTINPRKIVLGVPTYGYEYEVSFDNNKITYKRLRSHSFFSAMNRAELNNVLPKRNKAGELEFIYATSTFATDISPNLTWNVSSTFPIDLMNQPTSTKSIRFVDFSDAQAIKDKIDLAKKMNLYGVAFFKWDGDEDPLIWEIIK
jgi:spore germination protein YaaH